MSSGRISLPRVPEKYFASKTKLSALATGESAFVGLLDTVLDPHGHLFVSRAAQIYDRRSEFFTLRVRRDLDGLAVLLEGNLDFSRRSMRMEAPPKSCYEPVVRMEDSGEWPIEVCADPALAYHRWYYSEEIWTRIAWRGVPCLKSVMDLWSYQEILWERQIHLVIEFGTWAGGSAVYFADILARISSEYKVLSIDKNGSRITPMAREDPHIEFLEASSVSSESRERILQCRREYPGSVFFIVDSDHSRDHVFKELLFLRELTQPEDYVVVEDGNVNGHPVVPDFGPGPWEALEAYFAQFPNDYRRDEARERKFGWTWAPRGFLIRDAQTFEHTDAS